MAVSAQLVGAEGGSEQLREQLKSATGATAALRTRIDLARKRVQQNQELADTGAGLEGLDGDTLRFAPQLGAALDQADRTYNGINAAIDKVDRQLGLS